MCEIITMLHNANQQYLFVHRKHDWVHLSLNSISAACWLRWIQVRYPSWRMIRYRGSDIDYYTVSWYINGPFNCPSEADWYRQVKFSTLQQMTWNHFHFLALKYAGPSSCSIESRQWWQKYWDDKRQSGNMVYFFFFFFSLGPLLTELDVPLTLEHDLQH